MAQATAPVLQEKANVGNGQSPWLRAWRRFLRDKYSVVALVVLVVVLFVAILAPLIASHDPIETNPRNRFKGPSSDNWLGTDSLGRDIFSRLVYGARLSLMVGFMAVAIGLTGGVVLGLTAAYFDKLDNVIMRIIDILLAFPSILLALTVSAALGPGLEKAMVAVGIVNIPLFARLTRGQVLAIKERDFVSAARVAGSGDLRILFRHILPNILGVLIVYSTLRIGQAIVMASTLGFLGLGAQPPMPEWGAMVSSGRQYLRQYPLVTAIPSMAIFLVVLCANLLGDGLRDALDPKMDRS